MNCYLIIIKSKKYNQPVISSVVDFNKSRPYKIVVIYLLACIPVICYSNIMKYNKTETWGLLNSSNTLIFITKVKCKVNILHVVCLQTRECLILELFFTKTVQLIVSVQSRTHP